MQQFSVMLGENWLLDTLESWSDIGGERNFIFRSIRYHYWLLWSGNFVAEIVILTIIIIIMLQSSLVLQYWSGNNHIDSDTIYLNLVHEVYINIISAKYLLLNFKYEDT